MQNQKINPKTFNVTEKALNTLFTFEGQIEDKCLNVEITNDAPIMVNADPDAIHQVFYNLIHNAVKFSPTGGSLLIDLRTDEQKKKAVITIKNDGEGIPEEEVPHVFEKFYKTDRSRGLDKSGMGLGLFIVKTAIDNHKEKITVESGTGRGCAFTFTLPLVQ
jgi:signal transduction histidine kinase